jgi:hypothetical protein
VAIVLAGLAAAGIPASAATTRHMAAAGPAFSGAAIVWGEEPEDGSASVLRWTPGGRIERLYRIPAPRSRNREVAIRQLTASAERVTFARSDDHVVERGSDFIGYESRTTTLGSLGAAAFAPLLTGCTDGYSRATATDGATVALATRGERCADGTRTDRVWLIDGPGPPRLMFSAPDGDELTGVALAGPYLAWSVRDRITIVRRADGAPVADYTAADLGARFLLEWDLDADATIVATTTGRSACRHTCVRVQRQGAAPRTITRRGGDDVAIAGGRLAFATYSRGSRGIFVLTDLDGRVLRHLDRTTRDRGLLGFALEPDRIAWAMTLGDRAAGSHWTNRGLVRTTTLP